MIGAAKLVGAVISAAKLVVGLEADPVAVEFLAVELDDQSVVGEVGF